MTQERGRIKSAYLFADPVSHTLSPAMHNAAFADCQIAGQYQARRVTPAELGAAIQDLRHDNVFGANLTLPHKEAALAYVDTLSPAAQTIGAINTIINRGGVLHGDNTDAPGLQAALAALGDPGRGAAVVLGAGGAARAAVYALLAQDRSVYVVNRTLERAQRLTDALGGVALRCEDVPWNTATLIVNASSAGLNNPVQTPLPDFDFVVLPKEARLYDMVYRPSETRLMAQARAAGISAENGLTMLAWQARLAFLAWTGRAPNIAVFLGALFDSGAFDSGAGVTDAAGAAP
ncbi:shikimate dehydrogenase [Deinococcus sp.]|uniref:shikimate dehydrogenase n=1 Tax=Deinococcus sp. TaxID=47478 RepID=UPI003B5A81C5